MRLMSLAGPLPVPTFDQYFLVVDALSRSKAANRYRSILSQTAVGQEFGNLLRKGDLHFAPAGREVTSLIEHLNSTTATFRTLKYHVHASEEVAVDYILHHLSSRAFALVVLREISEDKVNYVIRQNYTTLPNTNSFVDRCAHSNKQSCYVYETFYQSLHWFGSGVPKLFPEWILDT